LFFLDSALLTSGDDAPITPDGPRGTPRAAIRALSRGNRAYFYAGTMRVILIDHASIFMAPFLRPRPRRVQQ